ncbi:MAG: glycosyltransferase family 9 protein [Phycisphaerales bacterium]
MLTALLGRLRSARYDVVLDCQGLLRSGLLTLATGAPMRIGHADAREGAPAAYTHAVDPAGAVHTVDRMLTLLSPLGVEVVRDMRLYAPPADLAAVDADARPGAGAEGRAWRTALFAPTSRWVGKRWPAERFADLARRLLARGFDRIAVVGTSDERDQCAPLAALAASEPRVIDLIGATSVGRLMALVARSALVVANDSAALHMAVGFDRPIVALYGPTDVSLVGPYGRGADVVQHLRPGEALAHKDEGAGRAMMERISVDEVEARALAAAARAT